MRTNFNDAYDAQEDHVRVAINAALELRHHSSHMPDERKSNLFALVGL